MLYFNPKPNFQTLANYYQLQHTAEIMDQQYPDGYPIVINSISTDEMVEVKTKGFKEIITRYRLNDHQDNLLFLVLVKVDEIEAILDELYFQYDQKKRTKELAGLLLCFTQSPLKDYNSLLLKTFKNSAKVADEKTIQWIGSVIIDSIKKGLMPACDFEYSIMNAFFDDINGEKQINEKKLLIESKKTIQTPWRKNNALNSDFCFYLYDYLINETNIKPDPTTLLSDAQLKLYFDLLVLFGYINPDKIDSEQKDYMGTLLKNRIKSLNPHYQGNKTKKN